MEWNREYNSMSSSKTSQSVALLPMKEKEEESHFRDSDTNMEDDDPKVITMSEARMMKHKLLPSPENITADIKFQLMKEIRQFGRKYEKIFQLLEGVQGPLEVRKQLVEFAIKEAARFKRRHLIQQLENLLEKVHSDHFQNTPNM